MSQITHPQEQRILKLLQDGQITKEESETLRRSLKPKSAAFTRFVTVLLNPFDRISGWPAAMLGLLVAAMTSLIAREGKIHFPGFLDLQAATPDLYFSKLTWLSLVSQNLINAIVFALISLMICLALRQKALRIQDFLGNAMLARFPYLFATLAITGITLAHPEIFTTDVEQLRTQVSYAPMILLILTSLLALAWQLTVYYQAFKVSSGLKSKRLWLGFTSAIILSEILTIVVLRAV